MTDEGMRLLREARIWLEEGGAVYLVECIDAFLAAPTSDTMSGARLSKEQICHIADRAADGIATEEEAFALRDVALRALGEHK